MGNRDIEIVLVEDDPNDAELIERVLSKHNLAEKLLLLRDGAEALDFFFAGGHYARERFHRSPKLVLLDLKLPKVSGMEVLQRLRSDKRTKDLPVVVLTSSREERDLKSAYEIGANSYVTKSIVFSEFSKAVAEIGSYWLLLNQACDR